MTDLSSPITDPDAAAFAARLSRLSGNGYAPIEAGSGDTIIEHHLLLTSSLFRDDAAVMHSRFPSDFSLTARTGDYAASGDEGGKVRAEFVVEPSFSPTSTLYMKVGIFLDSLNYPSNRCLIYQNWQGSGDDEEYPGSPPLSFRGDKDEGDFFVSLKLQDPDPENPTRAIDNNLGWLGLRESEWNDIEAKVVWGQGGAGSVEVWCNGVKVADYTGPTGYGRDHDIRAKIGPYRNETDEERASAIEEYTVRYRGLRVSTTDFGGRWS